MRACGAADHGRLPRHGAALLEVIVSLTLLATVGVAAAALVRESARAVGHAHESDRLTARASAFFEASALWSREDLELRLGLRRQGPWHLRIERPLPVLYMLSLTDTLSGREILRTSLYRPLPHAAAGPRF